MSIDTGYRAFCFEDTTGGNVAIYVNDADEGIIEVFGSQRVRNYWDFAQDPSASYKLTITNARAAQRRKISVFLM